MEFIMAKVGILIIECVTQLWEKVIQFAHLFCGYHFSHGVISFLCQGELLFLYCKFL